jgi:signal peptidase II
LGGCLVDVATKSWVFARLGMPGGETLWLWPGHIGLQTSLNEGALFGIGQGMVPVFAGLSFAALLGILYWLFWCRAATDWLLTVALACVTAGILGNLYDRLGLPGLAWNYPAGRIGQPVYAVRDWVLLQWSNELRWPNFNIADSLLVLGAGLILYHAFTTPAESQSASRIEATRQGE